MAPGPEPSSPQASLATRETMAARPLKRIKSPGFIKLHEFLRVAKTTNRRFILGIFEHVGIDFRPSVKTPVYQPDLFGSRGYFRILDARPMLATGHAGDRPYPNRCVLGRLAVGLPWFAINVRALPIRGIHKRAHEVGTFMGRGRRRGHAP